MTKAKVLLVVCFIAALAAGVAAGRLWARLLPPPPQPAEPRSMLEQQLKLTPQQRDQMKEIWSNVGGPASWQKMHEQRAQLQKERNEQINALLTPEQKEKYDTLMKAYDEKLAALDAERRKEFDEARERTRPILTAEQWNRYEELMKQRGGEHRRRGPGRGPEGNEPRPVPTVTPPPPEAGAQQ